MYYVDNICVYLYVNLRLDSLMIFLITCQNVKMSRYMPRSQYNLISFKRLAQQKFFFFFLTAHNKRLYTNFKITRLLYTNKFTPNFITKKTRVSSGS